MDDNVEDNVAGDEKVLDRDTNPQSLVILKNMKARLSNAIANWGSVTNREVLYNLLQLTQILEGVLHREPVSESAKTPVPQDTEHKSVFLITRKVLYFVGKSKKRTEIFSVHAATTSENVDAGEPSPAFQTRQSAEAFRAEHDVFNSWTVTEFKLRP